MDLARLRIGFLAGTLGQGGSERQLYYILRTLRQLGCQPHLFSNTQGEFWEQPIRSLNVPVTWIGKNRSPLARLLKLHQELRRLNLDIVQSHHFFTNPYTAFAARASGKMDVGAIRNDVITEIQANGPILGQICLKAPRILAANSMNGICNAINAGVAVNRLRLLPNIVDCETFKPLETKKSAEVVLLTIGRLDPQKNQQLFLQAIARLGREYNKPVIGRIAGDGPCLTFLKKSRDELGLSEDQFEFLGLVADPIPLYQSADIFILTSDWEGTPNVVMEAMACGLAVVATRVGGVSDLIEDGKTGLLIEPGNLEMLVEVLINLIERSDLRESLGAEARQHIKENCDLATLPETLSNFYASL